MVFIPVFACLVTAINGVMTQHGLFLLKETESLSNKIITTLVFNKMFRASRDFLKVSDSSLIKKIVLFEARAVSRYYKSFPNFFIFPMNMFLATSAMLNVLG